MKLKIAIILFITIVAVWLAMDKISDEEIFVQTEPQDAVVGVVVPVVAPHIVIVGNNKTTMTAYTLSVNETDDSPCIGAGNNNLCELRPILKKENKTICASRDLPLDTEIYIEGYGICVIKDRMNKRYLGTNRIDILMDTKEEAINFGIRELNYIIIE